MNFIPLIPGNEWLVYRLGNELVVRREEKESQVVKSGK